MTGSATVRLASPLTCARRQANTWNKVLGLNQEVVVLAPILSPPILSLVPAGDVLDQGVAAEPLVLLQVARVQDGHDPSDQPHSHPKPCAWW